MESFFDEHDNKIREFVEKFRGYSIDIDAERIRNWIRRFDEEDWGLALKVLDWVDYYDNARVCRELRILHAQIAAMEGFDMNTSCFAPFCRVGHSGEIILERYRFANGFKSHRLDEWFIHLSELNLRYDMEEAMFFFIEDFIGTGDSTFQIWKKVSDYIPSEENLFLLVIVGHQSGIARIERELPLKVVYNRMIYEDAKIFSDSSQTFSDSEKTRLREYCERADEAPEGYGECQSNVIFYYRAPDNTISILRCNNPDWQGLFIRNL